MNIQYVNISADIQAEQVLSEASTTGVETQDNCSEGDMEIAQEDETPGCTADLAESVGNSLSMLVFYAKSLLQD